MVWSCGSSGASRGRTSPVAVTLPEPPAAPADEARSPKVPSASMTARHLTTRRYLCIPVSITALVLCMLARAAPSALLYQVRGRQSAGVLGAAAFELQRRMLDGELPAQ